MQVMKYKLKKLYTRFKYLIWYGIFGCATVFSNVMMYALCYHSLEIANVPSNIIAWVVSTTVAFVTNKQWVFKSTDWSLDTIRHEATGFYAIRVFTGVFEVIMMYIAVDVLSRHAMSCKVVINIICIILNLFGAKIVVFKDQLKKNEQK